MRYTNYLYVTTLNLGLLCFANVASCWADEQVYEKTLPHTVWLRYTTGNTINMGSGVVIDAGRRWVLTCYHVVGDQTDVQVFFPTRVDGEWVAEREHYLQNASTLAVAGKVVCRDYHRDLAIVEVERLPEGAQAAPQAASSPRQGQRVHLIGSPAGGTSALWLYSSGTVRQVYTKRSNSRLGADKLLFIHARVLEVQLPINPGDSGGPVFNDAGELVGLVSNTAVREVSIGCCIHLSEIQAVLRSAEKGDALVSHASNVPIQQIDARVLNALDGLNLPFALLNHGLFRVTIDYKGQGHSVCIDSRTQRYSNLEMRRVWAVARTYPKAPPAEVVLQLLKDNLKWEVGAWEIDHDPSDGRHYVVFCARVPANANAADLKSAINFARIVVTLLPAEVAESPGETAPRAAELPTAQDATAARASTPVLSLP